MKTCEDGVRAQGPGGWWSRELGVNLEARSVDATEVARQSVNLMGKAIEAFVRARLGGPSPLEPARRPRVAKPPARAPDGRFTSASASYFGKRGAAGRERRFLERHASAERSPREERQALSSAIALVHQVYGPRWRPRRVPRHEFEITPWLAEIIQVLAEALDAEQTVQRLRAAETLLYLISRLDPSWSHRP